MPLSLRESKAIADMAELLYDFLPGSGNRLWKGHVSFKSVAEKVGVGNFWQIGSKIPMITALLQRTLEYRRASFEPLILEIVRAGITYRQKANNPIQAREIEKLNGLLLEVEFRFPDLWDAGFLSSLQTGSDERAKQRVDEALAEQRLKAARESCRSSELCELREEFFALSEQPNRQAAGIALEKVLNRLFALDDLTPRVPFSVVGEQIDGSFDLDHETFLVSAKWEKDPLPERPLNEFRGVIEGKSAFTRGVFISVNGITDEARSAITRGKQPLFFVVDGYDLTMILLGQVELNQFLRQRQRLLAEEGAVVVPFRELWIGSRGR